MKLCWTHCLRNILFLVENITHQYFFICITLFKRINYTAIFIWVKFFNVCFVLGALAAHPTGNVLIVDHSVTLEACSNELVGKKPKLASDLMKLLPKIPYCGLMQIESDGKKWEIVQPPCLPLTHSNNPRYDWKIMID